MRALAHGLGLVLLLAAVASAQAVPAFNITRLYRTEAEFTRAIQPYQQAIAANARNARAHHWLGIAYLTAYRQSQIGAAPYAGGYVPRAIASLREAISADPNLTGAYLALHDAYKITGEDAKANAVLDQMLQRSRPEWLPPVGIR